MFISAQNIKNEPITLFWICVHLTLHHFRLLFIKEKITRMTKISNPERRTSSHQENQEGRATSWFYSTSTFTTMTKTNFVYQFKNMSSLLQQKFNNQKLDTINSFIMSQVEYHSILESNKQLSFIFLFLISGHFTGREAQTDVTWMSGFTKDVRCHHWINEAISNCNNDIITIKL